MRGDCPTTVKIWNATDCAGTEMTDQEISASIGKTRTQIDAMFSFYGCGNLDCDFFSMGTPVDGQDCSGAGTTWLPKVLDKCMQTDETHSVKLKNCANGFVDMEDYSGSTDCSSGLRMSNSTAEGWCVKCDLSEVVISGGNG